MLLKQYGELAGIPKEKRYFHVLKHSIATHLLEAGAGLPKKELFINHRRSARAEARLIRLGPVRDRRTACATIHPGDSS